MKNILFKIALCLLPAHTFSQTGFEVIFPVPTLIQSWDQNIMLWDKHEEGVEKTGFSINTRDFETSDTWKPFVIDTNLYRILKFTWLEIEIERRDLPPSMQVYGSAYYYGKKFAPDYKTANCTELMTALLSRHYSLTAAQKKQVNVVIPGTTAKQLISDLKAGRDKPAYGGVCHFVEANNYGSRIHYWEDVLPGDLVQWWWFAGNSGHCGIVKEVNKKERWFSVYSSTPGQGFGVTRYPIDFDAHFYFARITATQKTP